MSSLNALYLITHMSALISKCSIYDSPCLSSLTQIYATTVIPGGTGQGIESLDPMMLDRLSGEQEGLIYDVCDIEIDGFKHTLVDKVQFNKQQRKSKFKLRVPNLTIFANYTYKGSVKTAPINGEGKLIFELFDLEFDITMNYDIVKGKDGKEYISYSEDFDYWFDMRYTEIYLENAHKEDPEKAAAVLELIRRESKSLWQQYGRLMLDSVTKRIVETVRKVLLILPAEQILSDYN